MLNKDHFGHRLALIHEPTEETDAIVSLLTQFPNVEVCVHTTLEEALSSFFYAPPDLILLSWTLEDNLSVKLVAEIRHFVKQIPLVVLIQSPSDDLQDALYNQGVCGLIPKSNLSLDLLKQVLVIASKLHRTSLEEMRLRDELLRLQCELDKRIEARTEQLAESKAEIEKNLEIRTRFLNRITQEIRNPIETIHRESASLLDTVSNSPLAAKLALIQRTSKRIVSFFENVLELTMLKADGAELEASAFQFEKLISDVLSYLNQNTYLSDVHTHPTLSSHIHKVLIGDHFIVFKLLRHLSDIAIQTCPAGTLSFRVDLLPLESMIANMVFSYAYPGPAISSSELEPLYQDFTKPKSIKPEYFKGVGPHVAIATILTHALKGSLKITCQNGAITIQSEIPISLDPSYIYTHTRDIGAA